MKVFAGTYQGSLLTLQGYPDDLRISATRQVSENSIRSMDIDKQDILLGGYDQQIKCLNVNTEVEEKQEKQSAGIINKITRIGQHLFAIGLDNGLIRIWDSQKWGIRKQLKQHKKGVSDIKVDQRGLLMLSAAGQQIIFWNLQTLKSLYHYKFDYTIQHILIPANFQHLFILETQNIRKITTAQNKQILKIKVQEKIQCGLIFLKYLIVATEKGNIKIWDMDTLCYCIYFQAHNNRIKDIKQTQFEGADYLITADSNGTISVWDILEFIKGVDNLSQDYPLQGLKPIHSLNTNQRIIALTVYQIPENTKVFKNQQKNEKKSIQKKEQTTKKNKHNNNKQKNQRQKVQNNLTKAIDKKKKIIKAQKKQQKKNKTFSLNNRSN